MNQSTKIIKDNLSRIKENERIEKRENKKTWIITNTFAAMIFNFLPLFISIVSLYIERK